MNLKTPAMIIQMV
jgi:hypothetical protein